MKGANGRTIAASSEGYGSKHWAVANVKDATGIPIAAPGRDKVYAWDLTRDARTGALVDVRCL